MAWYDQKIYNTKFNVTQLKIINFIINCSSKLNTGLFFINQRHLISHVIVVVTGHIV